MLHKGLDRIRKFLNDGVTKGKVPPEVRERALGNLSGATSFDALKHCDLVIEAIVENLDEKRRSYGALEDIIGEEAIFVSNTSSLCITELAAATKLTGSLGCTFSTRCR